MPPVGAAPGAGGLCPPRSRDVLDEVEMQIVYVMEVIDPSREGAPTYVRRFTYLSRRASGDEWSSTTG
jgi:hypothetical protein